MFYILIEDKVLTNFKDRYRRKPTKERFNERENINFSRIRFSNMLVIQRRYSSRKESIRTRQKFKIRKRLLK